MKTLKSLYALWDDFCDLPFVEDPAGGPRVLGDCFLQFTQETPEPEVWRWFESQHPHFRVEEVRQGIRRAEDGSRRPLGPVRVRVEALAGPALDWAVARLTWGNLDINTRLGYPMIPGGRFNPSENWSQGAPFLKAAITKLEDYGDRWGASGPDAPEQFGLTAMVAVLRYYVASKVGETIDVPRELAPKDAPRTVRDASQESGHWFRVMYRDFRDEELGLWQMHTSSESKALVLFGQAHPETQALKIVCNDDKRTVFTPCGSCGHLHQVGFLGDCRDDLHRYTPEDLDFLLGEDGWSDDTDV